MQRRSKVWSGLEKNLRIFENSRYQFTERFIPEIFENIHLKVGADNSSTSASGGISGPDVSMEVDYFENYKLLSPALKELVKELLLIKSTSVDSERAFIICATIDTCYRARILPEKFCKMVFINQNLFLLDL